MIKRNIPGYIGSLLLLIALITNIAIITDGIGSIETKGYELTNIIICGVVAIIWVVLSTLKQRYLAILPCALITFEMTRMLNSLKELSIEYGEIIKGPSYYLIMIGTVIIIISTILNIIFKDKKMPKQFKSQETT